MTKFTLRAKLEENKNLTILHAPMQNQGENNCTELEISVPGTMAQGVNFYVEFWCPKNKRYISPKITPVTQNGQSVVVCDLPSCVLQEEGFVQFQLVARSADDTTLIYKSNYSNRTSFYVHASVNASQTYTVNDYFAKVEDVLEGARQTLDTLNNTGHALESLVENSVAQIRQDTESAIENEVAARENAESDIYSAIQANSSSIEAAQGTITNHCDDTNNPHGVTKEQVGLDNVANERQYSAQNPNFGTATPVKNGTGTCGVATTYSRSDHVHPTDTTRAATNDVVHVSSQILTPSQRSQARANIGAGTSNFSGSFNDLNDVPLILNSIGGLSGQVGVGRGLHADEDGYVVDSLVFPKDSKNDSIVDSTYYSLQIDKGIFYVQIQGGELVAGKVYFRKVVGAREYVFSYSPPDGTATIHALLINTKNGTFVFLAFGEEERGIWTHEFDFWGYPANTNSLQVKVTNGGLAWSGKYLCQGLAQVLQN